MYFQWNQADIISDTPPAIDLNGYKQKMYLKTQKGPNTELEVVMWLYHFFLFNYIFSAKCGYFMAY